MYNNCVFKEQTRGGKMKKLIIIPFIILATVITIYGIDNYTEVKLKVKGGYIYGNIIKK